jgi:hypothetical protein
VLRFLGLLLAIWLAITVVGFVVHTLFWLAVLGLVLFVGTAAIGWARRDHRALPPGR